MRAVLAVLAALLLLLPAVARAGCDGPPPCTVGGLCQSDGDCAAGYHCLDNGTGTKYCVGPTCTSDAQCGGSVVCRAYCTLVGDTVECGDRRCQCAGFGCTGANVLCTDDGSLACRMFCTQDSDCIGPFGGVCVNPGFSDGVCIGSLPCQ